MKLKENVDFKVLEELGIQEHIFDKGRFYKLKEFGRYFYHIKIDSYNFYNISIERLSKSPSLKLKSSGKLYKQLIKDLIEKGLVE